jgi:hypothetical protein
MTGSGDMHTDTARAAEAFDEELRKVREQSEKKLQRHRVDDYVAIILAVGAVFILWLLQFAGVY